MILKYFKEKEKFWYKTKNFWKIQVWGAGAAVDQNAYRATDTTGEKKKSDLYFS